MPSNKCRNGFLPNHTLMSLKRTEQKVCNKEITAATSVETGESYAVVHSVINHVVKEIKGIIATGQFEEIQIRRFGKFKPRMHMLSQIQENRAVRLNNKAIREALKQQQNNTNGEQ
jgi:hypothetical protein